MKERKKIVEVKLRTDEEGRTRLKWRLDGVEAARQVKSGIKGFLGGILEDLFGADDEEKDTEGK